MYCFQCQEAAKNEACTHGGVCGKTDEVSALQDLLNYSLKGISVWAVRAREAGITDEDVDTFVG